MKKIIISLSTTLLLLAGCGDKIPLDKEKVEKEVSKQALNQREIKEQN